MWLWLTLGSCVPLSWQNYSMPWRLSCSPFLLSKIITCQMLFICNIGYLFTEISIRDEIAWRIFHSVSLLWSASNDIWHILNPLEMTTSLAVRRLHRALVPDAFCHPSASFSSQMHAGFFFPFSSFTSFPFFLILFFSLFFLFFFFEMGARRVAKESGIVNWLLPQSLVLLQSPASHFHVMLPLRAREQVEPESTAH